MIEWLSVRDLALVEKIDVEFDPGFNVITGETGAGKSVLMGAVGLILGERADKSSVRSGAKRCEICAGLKLEPSLAKELAALLDDAGVELDPKAGTLQVRRVITASSTRNFVNDTPVILNTLKLVGDRLIDIHGANEHQSLIKPSTQLALLDRYGNLDKDVAACAEVCERVKDVENELQELESTLPSPVEAEHLRLVIKEIDDVAPRPGEDAELSSRHNVVAGSKQILEITSRFLRALNEDEDCLTDRFSQLYRELTELAKIDPDGVDPMLNQCDHIAELIRDLGDDVSRYADKVDIDEGEFHQLEERLAAVIKLKRRYGPELENVMESREDAVTRLERHDNAESLRTDLTKRRNVLNEELDEKAKKLSDKRRKIAAKFSKAVAKELKKLGFLTAEFETRFSRINPGPNGRDQIEFVFSANPGEPMKPLRDVASSGEISRVMLALKTVLAEADAVPILIFDEIDANIGGKTAGVVGGELANLAKTRQVLCVSHLPQVAARAQRHFLVEKSVVKKRTLTTIHPLAKPARANEIARMLGGGPAAERHARDMLK